jgi:hypothetical protein
VVFAEQCSFADSKNAAVSLLFILKTVIRELDAGIILHDRRKLGLLGKTTLPTLKLALHYFEVKPSLVYSRGGFSPDCFLPDTRSKALQSCLIKVRSFWPSISLWACSARSCHCEVPTFVAMGRAPFLKPSKRCSHVPVLAITLTMLSPGEITAIKQEIDRLEKALANGFRNEELIAVKKYNC